MEKVTYYSKINGIAVEHMIREGKFDMRVNHFHNEYEIFYLAHGERHFFFNNRAYLATSGDLILVDTNIIHMTRATSDKETGHERIILYVDKEKMEQFDRTFPHIHLTRFFKENHGIFRLTAKQQQEFMTLYTTLRDESTAAHPSYQSIIELEVINYLARFARDADTHIPASHQTALKKNNTYNTVYAIADYISEYYYEPITLEFLADKFFLSKFYLSRVFKEISGHGINEYVNIFRIKQAKRLLEETELSVSLISQKVGYSSVTYFEKVFKIYMTLSPLKYRKTLNIVTYKNTTTPSNQEQ